MFSTASLLKSTNFNAIPFGIRLYSANQFKKLIVFFFNGVTSNFFITFLVLKFLLLFFSDSFQTTPVILDFPKDLTNNDSINDWLKDTKVKFNAYKKSYEDYFKLNNKRFGNTKIQLDPLPRLILIPKIGLIGIGKNKKSAKKFLNGVKSSIAMHNTSTQFADGGEFGFGGEVGISTNTLPPRGPVGLNQLISYKYQVTSKGQIRK